MEKPVAVIEICSKSVKVVIGYVIDGQVQIIYKNTYDVGHIVENGSIIDYNSLVTALKNINYIEDAEAKLKIKIGEAVIALPPFGINVFQIKQSTNIVSDEGIVSSFDLRNVYSLIRKCNIDKNMTLIDIVPNEYILDNNRAFLVPPIGQNSSTLSVQVKLHVLPSHIYINYRNVINDANLIVKRCIASPQGAVELLGTYKEIPQDYILVDIGSRTTTVSLVGKKEVYDSRFFEWGSDFITEHLVSSFNINECDAEKYKILYGYDKREYSFDPIICTSLDDQAKEINHRLSDLKAITKEELDVFVKQLCASIESLLSVYNDPNFSKMPMVLIGGGSLLKGLKGYLEPKVPSETLIFAKSKVLGARNPSYISVLGMILCNHKYPSIYDESHSKVSNLSRNPKKEE